MAVDSTIRGTDFAANRCGDIILLYDGKITVIYSTGESKDVMFSESTETNVLYRWAIEIAVDSNDKVHVRRKRARYT